MISMLIPSLPARLSSYGRPASVRWLRLHQPMVRSIRLLSDSLAVYRLSCIATSSTLPIFDFTSELDHSNQVKLGHVRIQRAVNC